MTTRDRIAAMLADMHGRPARPEEIDIALRGYNDAKAEIDELEQRLSPDQQREALQAETERLLSEILDGPRRPN